MSAHRNLLRGRQAPGNILALLLCAAFLPFGFRPAAAQYAGPFDDERSLSKEEQRKANNRSLVAITGLNATHTASIPLGVVPVPQVSYPAEIIGTSADISLKWTKAVLEAPADVARFPDTADSCSFDFELPQSTAMFRNFLGLWPKLGDDRLFLRGDEPISFGVLGVPEIAHANTEVLLSVHSPSAGIFRAAGDAPSSISVPAGRHEVLWRADTLVYPVFDVALPVTLTAFMMATEFKFAKHIRRLRGVRDDLLEMSSVKANPKQLARQIRNLNRKIRFLEKFPAVAGTAGDKAAALVQLFFEGKPTVSRVRTQAMTVYDVLAPSISTTTPNVVLEATDIGGTTTARYFQELQSSITASDACNRPFTVVNDAPDVLPLGATEITWTVRDAGPVAPGTDLDADGEDDPHLTASVTQIITVEDTQAPIMVPPPGLVIVSDAAIELDGQALGQPLVVDLADLHPDVTSTTTAPGGMVPVDTRAVVTWSATDASGNAAAAEQLVTVKTGNSAPGAQAKSADALTAWPVDIVLTGTDTDLLPYSHDPLGVRVPDPLQFRIEQLPRNGEFVAPLLPFFINDYRTDKVGGLIDHINAQPDPDALMDDYIFAVNTNALAEFLNQEFCATGQPAPIDFVYGPLYVHVTDEGEHYYFDKFLECDPNGTGSPEWAERFRISRWSADDQFLGHARIDDNGGGGIVPEETVFHLDGGFINFVNSRTGGQAGVLMIQRCPADFTDTTTRPPFCQNQADPFGGVDSGDMSDGADPENAVVDLERELVYVVTGARIEVFDFRHETPGDSSSLRNPSQYQATLVDDLDNPDILGQGDCGAPGSRPFRNSLEIDSAGNLYVTDNQCHRVHKFTASFYDEEGTFVRGEYVGWMGKCTGSNNLACDVDNQRTKGFSCTAGAECTVEGDENGSGIGQFFNPAFLAVDPKDVLYVADYDNLRIQRFGPDGIFAGQAQSTGNGINADTEGGFVLGNMGPPKHVSVNSKNFFVVDQSENFVHVFDTSPFKDVTDSSATVTYVSEFAFHSATDVFSYSVNDGLADSNAAQVTVHVARNYRQPLPAAQSVEVEEDRSVVIVLEGTDPDGVVGRDFNGLDQLTFEIVDEPRFGTLTPGGDTGDLDLDPGMQAWTYTPDRDYFGEDSFSFTVRDEFTDAAADGGTVIPEPYGEAPPAVVDIAVASVNDTPIVRITPPDRIAAGFPVLLQATGYDDIGTAYDVSLDWGDGTLDRNGNTSFDDSGTPHDSTDDLISMEGVIFSLESLHNVGQTPLTAMHTFTDVGDRDLRLCMRDAGHLEYCSSIEVTVEPLVALGVALELSHVEIVDGIVFDASIDVRNAVPLEDVEGLAAENVVLSLEIPEVLTLVGFAPGNSACTFEAALFECRFPTLPNGAAVPTIELSLRGHGQLVHDREIVLDAVLRSDTPALAEAFASSAAITVLAVNLDRDDDGLSNIFEALHGVSDPTADDDGDGSSNLEEFEADTSPVDPDTDGDGIGDADEADQWGSDPLDADTDNDGLTDGDEVAIHGTDPGSEDSDADGLPDDWELDNGYDPAVHDSGDDADGDGLNDAEEFANGTDHLDPDSDADALTDGEEVLVHETDPAAADTDQDGLGDSAELAAGSLPLNPDTDADGLPDGSEVLDAGTDPLLADTDRDGLPDGFELFHGRPPLLADYAVAAGALSSCALTDDGVVCWGDALGNTPELNDPRQLTIALGLACVIDHLADGSRAVVCWGDNPGGGLAVPALNAPVQVAAGVFHVCALDRQPDGTNELVCWGSGLGAIAAPTDLANPVRLVADNQASCVLDETPAGEELVCWGDSNLASNTPSVLDRKVGALDLGFHYGCLVADGERVCWGEDGLGQAPPDPVASSAVELASGNFHSCALQAEARDRYTVACWGDGSGGQTAVPALTNPLDIASGYFHSCALDEGSARCWGAGNIDRGQADPPILNIDPDDDGLSTADESSAGTNPLAADSDRDGIGDAAEAATDPLDSDSDDDGIADGDEINLYGSNPLNADTDGDGMPDASEIDNGLQPAVADAGQDADGDGLGNAEELARGTDPQQTDTDGDGLTDGEEAGFEPAGTLDPTAADSDGDGAFDGWEMVHGFDPAAADDGASDTDNDGLANREEFAADSNPHDADSDSDGMADGWEVEYGLDPLLADGHLDLDRDGMDNLAEFQQNGAVFADDVPPVLTAPGDVTADSVGLFTEVNIGEATAVDARDGDLPVTADDAGPFAPGPHTVTWSASDLSGNRAEDRQAVGVIPQVSFDIGQTVSEGDTVTVVLSLNGPANQYPVQVNYTVAGPAANPGDHDAAGGSVIIASGTSASIAIAIVQDAIFENEESFTLAMTDIVNAIPGAQAEHTVTISQDNGMPIGTIVMEQQGRRVSTASRGGGLVTVSLEVRDPNIADTHFIDWIGSDSGAFDPADASDAAYTIDPAVLPAGFYRLAANIVDDGAPVASSRSSTLLQIVDAPPVLDAAADTDADGIDDATEGSGDSDGDRVPDYRDAHDETNVLAVSGNDFLLEAQSGLSLVLGETAFRLGAGAGVAEASLSEDVEYGYPNRVMDFELHGVAPGGTALVVMPLRHPLPGNAEYRKLAANGWQAFASDAGNAVFSAPGSNGACPSPGHASYGAGLTESHGCVQLRLEDGGVNDGDGVADGVIRDPGGVAVPVELALSFIDVPDKTASAGTGGNVVMALRLVTQSGDVELDGLTLQASGSGSDSDIENVRLVVDANGNGAVDAGETAIGSGAFDSDDGTLELTLPEPWPIPPGQTDLLVTYHF